MDELFLSAVHAMNAHPDQNLLQKLSGHSVVNMLRACNSYLGQAMSNKEPFQAFGEKLLGLAANSRVCARSTEFYEDFDGNYLEDPCHAQLEQQLHPTTHDTSESCTQKYKVDCISMSELKSLFTEPSLEFQAMEPAHVELPISDVQAPVLDIVHEATFQQEDGSVSITFEVNGTEVTKTYNVTVDIFHGEKLIDVFRLPLGVGCGVQNTHALEIAGQTMGSYEVHFTLSELLGEIVGEKTILEFARKGESGFVISEYKVNPNNTTACSGSSSTEETVSTCTGSDNENQIYDGLPMLFPAFCMGEQWQL